MREGGERRREGERKEEKIGRRWMGRWMQGEVKKKRIGRRAHEAGKGKFKKKEICRALVAADFSEGESARAVSACSSRDGVIRYFTSVSAPPITPEASKTHLLLGGPLGG